MASPTNSEAILAAMAQPNYIPSDTTVGFMEESRDQATVVAILFVASLVMVIVVLRCFARIFIVKKFGIDDWLALLTLIPFIAFVAVCIVLIHLGSGRHFTYIQYILDNHTINMTEILDFYAHIIYTSALLICRLSGLAFYARIADSSHKLNWIIRGAAVFMILAYLPQVFLIVFHCLPVTGLWPYSFQAEVSNFTCLQWGEVYVTNSVISLVSDMILFTIPISIISGLEVSSAAKLKLYLVLMPGLLVIAISCARMYLVVVGQWAADESWSYDPLLAVEVSEIGSTLIALSVPALKPFFGTLFASLDRTFGSTMQSQSGRRDHRRRSQGRDMELDYPYDSSAESEQDSKAKNNYEPVTMQTGVPQAGEDEEGRLRPEDLSYTAMIHARDGRDPSIASNISQTPMIRYDKAFTVSHEESKTAFLGPNPHRRLSLLMD